MKMHRNCFVASIVCTFYAAIFAGRSLADPLPGETVKFQQTPMVTTFISGQAYFTVSPGSGSASERPAKIAA